MSHPYARDDRCPPWIGACANQGAARRRSPVELSTVSDRSTAVSDRAANTRFLIPSNHAEFELPTVSEGNTPI